MYEITYTYDGIIHKISVPADNAMQATEMFTHMMMNDRAINIINVVRK